MKRKRKEGKKFTVRRRKENCKKRDRQIKFTSIAGAILSIVAREAHSLYDILHELGESEFSNLFAYPTWYPELRRYKYYSVSLSRGLASLEKGGYIRREGKQTVFLTKKGIKEILKYKMKARRQEKPWDGKWRLIVFDIKEVTRKDRDYLRRQLKWIGFQELQKSVWIFPFEIKDELKEFIKLCKFQLQGDVRFILADTIDPDLFLRKKFNLS